MTNPTHPPIVIFSAGIGAGHDGAARELSRRLLAFGFPVVRHDFLDMLPAGFGGALRNAYARQLRTVPASWGWLLRAMGGPRMAEGASRFAMSLAADRMRERIGPDVAAVVSTYPMASQVLGRLRRTGRLHAPVAAVMTDPSVHRLCVADGVDLHLAPGRRTAKQILDHGWPALTVSPIVDPAFRPVRDRAEREAIRRRFGLPVDERLAVVVAGSWGVGDVAATADDIAGAGDAVPVVVCGRNEDLRRQVGAAPDAIALGWVDDMPELLRAADVVVHNAGGLSSVEAMASGVPVISYRCLPGHGVANAGILCDERLSPWPDSPAELATDVRRALDGSLFAVQREAFAASSAGADAATAIAMLTGSAVSAEPAGTVAAMAA
jgi:UDP-N-acetylglucosamine:LPS N-acetylglucosamine transferase